MQQRQNGSDLRAIAVPVALAVTGIVFGALTSAINHGFGPGQEYVSKVLGSAWCWLLAAYAACLTGRNFRMSVRRGLAFLIPAILAYEIGDLVGGSYDTALPGLPRQFDLLNFTIWTAYYIILSLITAVVLSTILVATRSGGLVGFFGTIVVPGLVAYLALDTYRGLIVQPGFDPIGQVVNLTAGTVAAVVTGAVGLIALIRSLTRRAGIN
ncbi:hypothetical protein [Raineyella sp.]|uniref:Uncharacterized protein n=1 Tax=bioreactor metagenome TaxID=1076179 RepID=A0A644YCR0_9ZZZZ|nr:hypothetical protein [Raineyella sp.]MEA5154078.1 hypothetical protein [Raineyella sp.]